MIKKLILLSFIIGSTLVANNVEIFVKGEKTEKQNKPDISKGLSKIGIGIVAGLTYSFFLRPHRLIGNIKQECTKKHLSIERNSSHCDYKKIAISGIALGVYAFPAFLVVDGLSDLHVFKKIKEWVSKKSI